MSKKLSLLIVILALLAGYAGYRAVSARAGSEMQLDKEYVPAAAAEEVETIASPSAGGARDAPEYSGATGNLDPPADDCGVSAQSIFRAGQPHKAIPC
jgi:hypothetical protein